MADLDFPKVIAAAAASPLGVLSLLVLLLTLIALTFFRTSGDKVKLAVFGGVLLAFVGFGAAMLLQSGKAPAPDAPSPTPGALSGTWASDDGYTFAFTQNGTAIAYTAYHNGAKAGTGQGTLASGTLRYSFATPDDSGTCTATLAPDARSAAGTCQSGNDRWPLAITRQD